MNKRGVELGNIHGTIQVLKDNQCIFECTRQEHDLPTDCKAVLIPG